MKGRAASLLVLLVFLVGAAVPVGADAPRDVEGEYRRAAEQLACQCGCREQLTVCAMQNCHSATPMRAEIREKLAAGKSVEQILADFVASIGKQVLAAPTTTGFDLTAWIAPFFMLAAGLIFVSWVVVRMTRRSGPAAEPAGASYDARVDEELRGFEEES